MRHYGPCGDILALVSNRGRNNGVTERQVGTDIVYVIIFPDRQKFVEREEMRQSEAEALPSTRLSCLMAEYWDASFLHPMIAAGRSKVRGSGALGCWGAGETMHRSHKQWAVLLST